MSTFFDSFPISLELASATQAVFLDAESLSLAIAKERLRSDRHRHVFSILAIDLLANQSDRDSKTKRFERILAERLRLTDERGILENGNIAVVLPQTSFDGAVVVLEAITDLAAKVDIYFHAKIHVYPDEDQIDFHGSSTGMEDRKIHDRKTVDNDPETVAILKRSDKVIGSGRSKIHFARVQQTANALPIISRPYPKWKRLMDLFCAGSGLIVSLPVLLLAAIAIKLTSKGPVFFRQWRTGHNGKPFSIVKLRTMVVDAEELKGKLRRMNERDGPAFKIKDDPRVTLIGKFLRATGIDELPQLWNVLTGEMSIVGPRPLPVEEDALCHQWHRRRLDTKPGITCLWQISKSRKISFDDWMRMDIRYTSSRSFWNDILLMTRTVAAVLLGRVGN